MRVDEYFSVKSQGDKEIGIEIEMEGANLFPSSPSALNYWNATGDGSLRGNPDAAEYVLRTPVKLNRVRARLEYLQSKLAKQGAELRPSDRCGVHVHLNVQSLSFVELFKILTAYFVMEPLLIRWCGEDREGNLFCLRAGDAEALISALAKAKSVGSMSKATTNSYRYASLNLAALPKYGSIEFRAMRTPEDFSDIWVWTRMLTRLRDYALAQPNETDIIEKVSSMSPNRLVNEVFGSLAHRLAYDDQHTLVLEGTDLAQNLAYIPLSEKYTKEDTKKKFLESDDRPQAASSPPDVTAEVDAAIVEQFVRTRNTPDLTSAGERRMRTQAVQFARVSGTNAETAFATLLQQHRTLRDRARSTFTVGTRSDNITWR